MFDHPKFDTYSFEEIPLNQDLYLVDELYMQEWEKCMLDLFAGRECDPTGYVSYIGARSIGNNHVELTWYTNIHTRFHSVTVSLPKKKFVQCVGCWRYDEKPRIFVKSGFVESLLLRAFSIFALVDAIGVKEALRNGNLQRENLIQLRDRIDNLSENNPDISFISFGDSILLKSNWNPGYSAKGIKYSYKPELFLSLADEISKIYIEILGLKTYTVITQGGNEYYDDALLHKSKSGNHICLNSLGIPFAQLMEIETAARKSIKDEIHKPAQLYMDQQYYHSIRFDLSFDKNNQPHHEYSTSMTQARSTYFYSSIVNILKNLNDSALKG